MHFLLESPLRMMCIPGPGLIPIWENDSRFAGIISKCLSALDIFTGIPSWWLLHMCYNICFIICLKKCQVWHGWWSLLTLTRLPSVALTMCILAVLFNITPWWTTHCFSHSVIPECTCSEWHLWHLILKDECFIGVLFIQNAEEHFSMTVITVDGVPPAAANSAIHWSGLSLWWLLPHHVIM